MDRPRQFDKSPESEIWNAIDAFEQILKAIPDDRTALETLFDAYDQIGDKPKSLEYLVMLVQVIIEEGDTDSVPWTYDSLIRIGEGNAITNQAIKELENLMLNMGLPSPSELSNPGTSSIQGVDVSSELSMAWTLRQSDQLTEDEYSLIVKDLTENSTKHVEVPVSVQHVLYDRNFSNLEKVLAFMSTDSGIPFVHLSMFEFDRSKFSTLSAEFGVRKGAMVFEQLGKEYLVAILNPNNQELRDEVEKSIGHPCHFYLTSAQDYDSYLLRSRQAATAAEMY